jgi:hypothetical protein
MTALTKLACALLLTGGLAAPAFAAGQTAGAASTNSVGPADKSTGDQSSMNGQNAMNAGPGGMRISQKLREDLGKAGFTDIRIMPSSFMVRAKDSQGNPVVMVINPDSVTALTEEKGSANSASNASHGETNNGNGAGPTPGPSSNGGSQPVTPGGAVKP